jgi:hypothetical protein
MPPGPVIMIEKTLFGVVKEKNPPDKGCGWLVLRERVEVCCTWTRDSWS